MKKKLGVVAKKLRGRMKFKLDQQQKVTLIISVPIIFCLVILAFTAISTSIETDQSYNAVTALSKMGSKGNEVKAIQEKLKERGLYKGNVDGIFGKATLEAVKKFQKQNKLTADGIAGPATLKKLGVSMGSVPTANDSNINLLARIISAEARGEPYIGQVAVGAVVLNRVEHPSFPDTLSGIIYQDGAFTAVTDGQFDEPISESAYRAAKDAFNGQDPTSGAIYYYNPDRAINKWIRTRPVTLRIGKHLFCT